jgi:hypothetical protein
LNEFKTAKAFKKIVSKRKADLRKYGKHAESPFLNLSQIKIRKQVKIRKGGGRTRQDYLADFIDRLVGIIAPFFNSKNELSEAICNLLGGLGIKELSPENIRTNYLNN